MLFKGLVENLQVIVADKSGNFAEFLVAVGYKPAALLDYLFYFELLGLLNTTLYAKRWQAASHQITMRQGFTEFSRIAELCVTIGYILEEYGTFYLF